MSGVYQRSSGLVQRRTVGSTQGADGGVDENEKFANGEEEEQDSKETRLTLMEEILLLGLKDREVQFIWRTMGWFRKC